MLGSDKCDVTFVEYGNSQPATAQLLSMEGFQQMLQKGAQEKNNDASAAEAGVTASEAPCSDDEESEEEKKPGNRKSIDDEPWKLTDRPPPPNSATNASGQRGIPVKGARVVGKNADGTPIYITPEEEAALRQRKKKDKEEEKKAAKEKLKAGGGVLAKLKKPKKEEKPETGTPVTAWTHQGGSSAPNATVPTPTAPASSPVPPPHPKLSPRRMPPAPPKLPSEPELEQLAPLPPIVAPVNQDDPLLVGHVFAVLSDLRHVPCDAWLVPCATRDCIPDSMFFLSKSARPRQFAGVGAAGLKYFGTKSTVTRAPGWPDEGRPSPYLARIAYTDGASFDSGFLTPLKQFLELSFAELAGQKPLHGRAKHLVALPASICGKKVAGMCALLSALVEHCRNRNVDVVVVSSNECEYEMLQAERLSVAFGTLSEGLRLKADDLARFVRSGRLAVFVGCAPSVSELLEESGLSEQEQKSVANLSMSDQIRVLTAKASEGGTGKFRLAHLLLASLPVVFNVSACSDDRFGAACAMAPRDKRTLFKLPADVSGGLLDAEKSKESLRGLAHTVLLHHQWFFYGCSSQMTELVRSALTETRQARNAVFGSLLTANSSPLLSSLHRYVDIVAAKNAVEHDLFIDYLAARSSSAAAHIFDASYDGCSAEDAALKNSVVSFLASLSEDAKKSPSFALLKNSLQQTFAGIDI